MDHDTHSRKELHMCTRRHQRRIIRAETERESQQQKYNVDNIFSNDFNNVFSNISSEPLQSLSTLSCDYDTEQLNYNAREQYDHNDIEQFDYNDVEDLELPNNVVDHEIDELPRNYSDESDDEPIDHDIDESDAEPIDHDTENTSTFNTLKDDLAQWAAKYKIHHNAINELLPIFLKHVPNCTLPRNARTLLGTPRQTKIVDLARGQYLHFGLATALSSIVHKYKCSGLIANDIKLSLNIDGLPISRSSTNFFWPILISDHIFRTVEIIGLYYGAKKPTSANDYLKRAVDEFKALINDGFVYENRLINVSLDSIICDTPAKSFILYTKGHTGFSSCSKCTIVGESINRTTCFPYEDVPSIARTDEDLIRQSDEEYHRGLSILAEVPNLGLVTNVALDYMHLICLGVVKKLLLLWIKGPLSVRISSNNCTMCSRHMVSLRDTVPSELSRKPRGLTEICYWKATEFRQFLLYTGPIVLQTILKKHIYMHFLTLHVAVTILISPQLVQEERNINYAEELLKYFVKNFQVIYGAQFLSHNIHNLLHLCDEVRKFGALDNFSTFPFENFMSTLKKKLRKSEKPLQQVARRYGEEKIVSAPTKNLQNLNQLTLKNKHFHGPLSFDAGNIDATQYKTLTTNSFHLDCDDKRNNCFLLKDDSIIVISNILQMEQKNIYVIGHKCQILKALYDEPCSSTLFNIYVIRDDNSNVIRLPLSFIATKMWRIHQSGMDYAIALRHLCN